MAYKQMTTLYGDEEPWFNLSNSVGRPGASRKDDVMLVQALSNFVAKRRAGDTSLLGFAIAHAPNEGCCMHDGRNDTRSAVGIPVVRSC